MSKFAEAQEEIYTTILRYANLVDRLWQNESTRQFVIDNFGVTHSSLVNEAIFWVAMRAQREQAALQAEENRKRLEEEAKKKVDATPLVAQTEQK